MVIKHRIKSLSSDQTRDRKMRNITDTLNLTAKKGQSESFCFMCACCAHISDSYSVNESMSALHTNGVVNNNMGNLYIRDKNSKPSIKQSMKSDFLIKND